MQITHKLTSLLLSLAALLLCSVATFAADPGISSGFNVITSDFPANMLVYNLYSSSAANPASQNTRINITNVNDVADTAVHFYYIDGDTCSVADNYICLTKNQTATIYASDVDPGVTGYILAIATDENGRPLADDATGPTTGRLLGDEYVKLSTGHTASLQAQAIPITFFGASPSGDTGVALTLNVPRVLAVTNIPSPAEGNNTLVVVNRLGGDLRVSMASIGSIFGILYDQLENPYSWTSSGNCQLRATLGPSFPRTAPRIGNVIPAGSTGWMKFWSTSAGDLDANGDRNADNPGRGLSGAVLNFNPNAANSATAFSGGHNLQGLTLTEPEILFFPIFPPNCD